MMADNQLQDNIKNVGRACRKIGDEINNKYKQMNGRLIEHIRQIEQYQHIYIQTFVLLAIVIRISVTN